MKMVRKRKKEFELDIYKIFLIALVVAIILSIIGYLINQGFEISFSSPPEHNVTRIFNASDGVYYVGDIINVTLIINNYSDDRFSSIIEKLPEGAEVVDNKSLYFNESNRELRWAQLLYGDVSFPKTLSYLITFSENGSYTLSGNYSFAGGNDEIDSEFIVGNSTLTINPAPQPEVQEVCNGIDDDDDGETDEGTCNSNNESCLEVDGQWQCVCDESKLSLPDKPSIVGDCNGCVDINEIINFIKKWMRGEIGEQANLNQIVNGWLNESIACPRSTTSS